MIYRLFDSNRDIDGVISVWNKDTVRHPINKRAFIRKILLDMNYDNEGFFVAEENGEVVGFIYAIKRKYPVDTDFTVESDSGYIVAMGVADRSNLQNIGKELLKLAEGFICKTEKRKIFAFSYSPNYFYQGVCIEDREEYCPFFESQGYNEVSRTVSKEMNLRLYSVPEKVLLKQKKLEEEGFRFGAPRVGDIPTLLSHTNPNFRHRIRRQLLEDGDLSKFSVAVYEGKVVGACVFGEPYSSEERFGPFGVIPEMQGKGLGTVILANCLSEMKKRELRYAWMQWASRSGPANTVYEKAGFHESGTYVTYCKD